MVDIKRAMGGPRVRHRGGGVGGLPRRSAAPPAWAGGRQSASEREASRRVSKRSRGSLLKVLDPDALTAEPPGRARSIALGIERLALIPFKAPTVTVLAALAIALLVILGIQRIKTD